VQGKVLLLSQRRIADLVAYCLAYEFEDIFAAVTDAQRIDATDLPALEFSRRAYKLARVASGSPRPVFSHIYKLYSLATIPNWRQCTAHSASTTCTNIAACWRQYSGTAATSPIATMPTNPSQGRS
jgi:hypothetical protein